MRRRQAEGGRDRGRRGRGRRKGTRSSVGREVGEDVGKVRDELDQNTLYEILKDK